MQAPDETRITRLHPIKRNKACQISNLTSRPSRDLIVFADVLQARLADHGRCLWRKAILANHTAKICNLPHILYDQKGKYLSSLRRMGFLYFSGAEQYESTIILHASFRFGGRIHILFHQLDKDVQEDVAPIVAHLLKRPISVALRRPFFQPSADETIVFAKGA